MNEIEENNGLALPSFIISGGVDVLGSHPSSLERASPAKAGGRGEVLQRSSALNEFTTIKPSWLVRKGIGIFFIITLALIGCTWFIPYPETITVTAKINATNPPKEVLAKQGRLTKLFKNDGDTVVQGDIIGFIQTTANHTEVLDLSQLLVQIKQKVETNNIEAIPIHWQVAKENFTQLGDLQNAHQNFIQAFLTFKNYLNSGFYATKKKLLYNDLSTQKKLVNNLQQQQSLQREDLAIAQQNYTVNEKMHKEELINDFEMRNQKSQWMNKKMGVPQMASAMINAEAQQNSIHKELMELDKQTMEQRNTFAQAVFSYYNTVEDWKTKNCILAPASGVVRFTNFIVENQPMEVGKPFCYITIAANDYSAAITIPTTSIAKVKVGMEVSLKLEAFPYQENGTVKGIITTIKEIPTDSGFAAKVIFPNGLKTTRGKIIPFSYGLTATGQLFTDNKRLLEKIMQGLVKR